MAQKEVERYIEALNDQLSSVSKKSKQTRYQAIVDAPFQDKLLVTSLGLGIVVFLLVNEQEDIIERIALSKTESANGAVLMSAKPFKDIRIPLSYKQNIISKTINQHNPHYTEDWSSLFAPALTGSQARFNQAGAGIEYSYVYPLNTSPPGALIFSYYQPHTKILGEAHRLFMAGYCNRVSWFLNNEHD